MIRNPLLLPLSAGPISPSGRQGACPMVTQDLAGKSPQAAKARLSRNTNVVTQGWFDSPGRRFGPEEQLSTIKANESPTAPGSPWRAPASVMLTMTVT
jgi:hypothetical protein